MDNRDLDPSDVEKYKAACDQAVQAVGTPSEVSGILGLNPSTLSRAINPNHPEVLLTVACALTLERLSGRPIFAALFASLTYHHCVPDDDGPDGGETATDLVEDITSITRENSEAVVSLGAVHQNRSPAAARAAMSELGDVVRVAQKTMTKLAPIAARARR